MNGGRQGTTSEGKGDGRAEWREGLGRWPLQVRELSHGRVVGQEGGKEPC